MDPLVSAHWLAERLDDPRLRVFDATVQVRRLLLVPMVRIGRREWRHGHIAGSAFANLFELSDPGKPRRTLTMPSAQRFSEKMGALGVDNDNYVVVYDRRENMWAARLWWMLRVFGFDDAAVLDGGWNALDTSRLPSLLNALWLPADHFPRRRASRAGDRQAGGAERAGQ